MTYKTYPKNQTEGLIPAHGGYRQLKSYQTTTLIYDLTIEFCNRYVRTYPSDSSNKANLAYSRTYDQMVQAARSGKQNIAEASQASGTSKKTELKLLGVARASLEELLQDFEDFLRQRNLPLWSKDHPKAREIRALAYKSDRSYQSYRTYLTNPETAANLLLTLCHQANYLLDQQLRSLEKQFLTQGGFTERLYSRRKSYKTYRTDKTYQK